jgi:hypothetical protein
MANSMLRILTFIILGLAASAWLWVVTAVLLATQDGNSALDFLFIAVTGAILLVFALPAFILALKRKLLWLAPFLALLSLTGVALVA